MDERPPSLCARRRVVYKMPRLKTRQDRQPQRTDITAVRPYLLLQVHPAYHHTLSTQSPPRSIRIAVVTRGNRNTGR